MRTTPRRMGEKSACPTCGKSRENWTRPDGYDGVHCCDGCAKGGPCTCPAATHGMVTNRGDEE